LIAEICALFAAITWSLEPLLMKRGLSTVSEAVYLFLKLLFASFLMLPLILITYAPLTFNSLIILLLISLNATLAYLSYVHANKYLEASVVVPVAFTYPFFASFFAIVFYQETLSLYKILATIFIVIGIWLIFFTKRISRKVIFPLLTSAFWGLNQYLFKLILVNESFFLVVWFRNIFSIIFLLPFLLKGNKKISKVGIKYSFINSILVDFIGISFYLYALKYGSVIQISSLVSISPVFNFIFDIILLKESISNRKILGIISCLTGTIIALLF